MQTTSLDGALGFIELAALPAPLEGATRAESTRSPAEFTAEIAESKSIIVGSEILSFENVPAEHRSAILNCNLLAQLVANHKVPDRSNLNSWYDHYFDSLMELGWSVEQKGLTDLHLSGQELKVHDAILAVATSFLGAGTAALALVVAALKALRQMDKDQPWITLFNRETHTEKAAKFQVGVASANAESLSIASMAFSLNSQTEITQILFFKGAASETRFRERHARSAIDVEMLQKIQPRLAKKLASRAMDYILGLPDLPEPRRL